MAEHLTAYQKRHPDRLLDLSHTLARRRVHHPLRSFLVVDEHGALHPPATSPCIRCHPHKAGVAAAAFVFTGQGASWARMGVDLLKSDPAFLADIRAMDAVLKGLPRETRPSWTIQGELVKTPATSRLDRAEFSQPVCAALQIALTRRLRRHGVSPGAVVGHSSGEIAAAYAAGALSLEDAVAAAYYRGYVCRSAGAKGGMLAVSLGRDQVAPYLAPDVSVACENSGSSVTLSGPAGSLAQVAEDIRAGAPDALVRMLKVDKAYHTDFMAAAAEEYFSLLTPVLRPRTPDVPFYSTVCGRLLRDASDFGPAHWRDNMVRPVLFRQAVGALSSTSLVSLYLEIGPHPALAGPLKQIASDAGVPTPHVAAMSRGASASTTFLSALGELHSRGIPVALPVPDAAAVLPDLPPYPWTLSETSWSEPRASRAWRLRACPPHPLLGVRSAEAGDAAPAWRALLSAESVPWAKDHLVRGDVVFPAAGYVAMAGEMVVQLAGRRAYTLRELSIPTALVLEPGRAVEVMSVVSDPEDSSEWRGFSIKSFTDGGAWTTHCTGLFKPGKASTGPVLTNSEGSFLRGVDTDAWYRAAARAGYGYGPEFRGMRDVFASVDSLAAKLAVGNGDASRTLRPTTLDVVFQALLVAVHSGHPRLVRRLLVPTHIDEISVDDEARRTADVLHVQASATTTGARRTRGDITARSPAGEPVVSVKGFTFTPSAASPPDPDTHGAIQMVWKPDIDLLPPSSLLQPQTDTKEHARIHSLLDRLSLVCAITIRDAASALPPSPTPPPHLAKLRAWVDAHVLRRAGLAGKALSSVVARDQEMCALHDSLSRTPARDAAALMLRCASHAEYLLTGAAAPLDLFLQDGALQGLYDWMNAAWGGYARLLGLLSHQRGNLLRVLEIGAGTGGLTARVLPHLSRGGEVRGTYVFTDVSAGFFPAARERFGAAVEYRVLDIGRDPGEQGFGGEMFDLIIASNVRGPALICLKSQRSSR